MCVARNGSKISGSHHFPQKYIWVSELTTPLLRASLNLLFVISISTLLINYFQAKINPDNSKETTTNKINLLFTPPLPHNSTIIIKTTKINKDLKCRLLQWWILRKRGMLRLNIYSNHVHVVLPTVEEEREIYSIDQIKEFEDVSQGYKDWLAELLEKGLILCGPMSDG